MRGRQVATAEEWQRIGNPVIDMMWDCIVAAGLKGRGGLDLPVLHVLGT